jgi:hypothetical protein
MYRRAGSIGMARREPGARLVVARRGGRQAPGRPPGFTFISPIRWAARPVSRPRA